MSSFPHVFFTLNSSHISFVFIGTIPIDPSLSLSAEEGTKLDVGSPTPTTDAIQSIIDKIISEIESH